MKTFQKMMKATGVARAAAPVADAVGGLAGNDVSRLLQKLRAGQRNTHSAGGAAIGAVAGYYAFGDKFRHPWIGTVTGALVGSHVPSLFRAYERRGAVCSIAETAFAAACSAKVSSHPVAAFVLGKVAASAVTYFTGLRG